MVVSTDLLLPPTEGDQLHIGPLYVLYLKQVRPVHLFKRYCIKFLLFFSTLVELKFHNIEKKTSLYFGGFTIESNLFTVPIHYY